MTTNRRKKISRQRGTHTHGWGSMKKHRGSGHKGGAGMSGTGKRADSKKPSIWKSKYFGSKGFSSLKSKLNTINASYIEQHIESFIKQKTATEENGAYKVDLHVAGYNKLLGSGKITKKLIIKVENATSKAIDSVKKAGGEVIIPKQKD